MGRKRSAACLAVTVLVLALLGCSGDDEETESARKAASELSAAVEQISDGLTTEGANALTALNKVIDESIEPRSAIAVLKRYADAAKSAEMRLGLEGARLGRVDC